MTIDKIKTDLAVISKDIHARAGHLSAEQGRVRTLAKRATGKLAEDINNLAGRIAGQSGDISQTAKRVQWMADALEQKTLPQPAPEPVTVILPAGGKAKGIAYGLEAPGEAMIYRPVKNRSDVKVVVQPSGAAMVRNLPPEAAYEVFDGDAGEGASGWDTVWTMLPQIGEPWTMDQFPEYIVTSLRLKDLLAEGRTNLAGYNATGLWGRTMKGAGPVIDTDGIHFRNGASATHPGRDRNPSMVRVLFAAVKVDDPTGKVQVVNLAGADGDWRHQPSMTVESGRLVGRWDMPIAGSTEKSVKVSCGGFIPGAWNICVIGTTNGRMWARLNGKWHDEHSHPDLRFSTRPNGNDWSFGAAWRDNNNRDVSVLEVTAIGGELSEKWVRKLEETKALEFGLPWGKAHVIEADDRYDEPRLDNDDFMAWRDANPTDAPHFFVNRGQPAAPIAGYTTVFHDDFRANTVGNSGSANSKHCNFYGPGWNLAVGGDHSNNNPQMPPASRDENYIHDPVGKSMTLRMNHDGKKWWAPAFYTVNDTGFGRAFKGGYVLRTITELSYIEDPKKTGGQLFPAEWAYALSPRIWQHLNRREFDFWEAHAPGGRNDANWAIVLTHEAHHSSYNPDPGPNREIVNGNITPERGWPFEVRNFGGKPIMREYRVDPDYTYISMDIAPTNIHDRSRLVEMFRFPTPKILLEAWYFIWNWSIQREYDPDNWEPAKQDYDYTVHDVLVMQRDEVVNAVPAPFAARPMVSKSADGKRLWVSPGLSTGVSHVDFYWHVDGYPFAVTREPTVVAPQWGGTVKVLVKASGYTDAPEAWSNEVILS